MKPKIELTEQQQQDKAKLLKLQNLFRAYLSKEGPYKYGILFRELARKDEQYLDKTYEVNWHYLEGVLEGVFGSEYGYQMKIEEFMSKTHESAGFVLRKPDKLY